MSADLDLEQRYRRALRLLPGYYRATWEEDMAPSSGRLVAGEPGGSRARRCLANGDEHR